MQTDILLKQLKSSLSELKASIEKFESHPSPSTQHAEQLYTAIGNSNKMVSAYLVLKEKKDVSPDLDLHIKLMSLPTTEEKKVIADVEPTKEELKVEPRVEEAKQIPKVEQVHEVKPVEPPKVEIPVLETQANKEYPKLLININDKFRFINELFKMKANEYNIVVEQLNAVKSWDEASTYLKGLTNIYHWDEEHELVKKLFQLTQKRFS